MPISMVLILVVVMAVPAYAVAVPSTFETPPVLRGSELEIGGSSMYRDVGSSPARS